MSERFKKVEPKGDRCVFYNRTLIEKVYGSLRNDPIPCSGSLTNHHIWYRREGGPDRTWNYAAICRGHQDWLHSRDDEMMKREFGDGLEALPAPKRKIG